MKEIEALLILYLTPWLGSIKIRLLIHYYGSAVAAIHADVKEICSLPGFNAKVMQSWGWWLHSDSWKRELALAHKHGVAILPYNSPDYPKSLFDLSDQPVVLYVKGKLVKQDDNAAAVIGTRDATNYGKEMAYTTASQLAASGMTVISGLARGIDAAAHSGALAADGGRTIAVIGSGLANVYPRENIKLADAIAQHGALISEFPMTTPPDRLNFPQRNRIVGAMSRAILLVEAPVHSGAMITVSKAMALGKPIFALCGRADMPSFKGNHQLIKSGKAFLIEDAKDLLGHFDDLFVQKASMLHGLQATIDLDVEEKSLLHALPIHEVGLDEIESMTKLSVRKLNVLLMSLVLKKMVKEFPGKIYKKCAGNV